MPMTRCGGSPDRSSGKVGGGGEGEGGLGKKLKSWYIWSVPLLTVRPNMYEQKH